LITLIKRDNQLKSSLNQTINDKDWPIFIENPLVPTMNASKNLVESEGERFRQTCLKASQILSDSNKNLVSLFDECRQNLPDDLIARAYPAPISIMPDLQTDIDQDELTSLTNCLNETQQRIQT